MTQFAVISDIHGNAPALRKVLEDAKHRGIEDFIIAGDYAISGAWPDECIEILQTIPKKLIIRGNEERYLENLIGKDQSNWTDGQMQISYWSYRNITPEHLTYLLGLPQTAECETYGVKIHVTHDSRALIGDSELEQFGSPNIAERYANKEVTPESLRRDIHEILNHDPAFLEKVNALEDGIYVFGHSHVQWSYKLGGRNVLLVNPGSCGLPLDAIKGSIPYSILTITESGEANVEEVRIPFDKKDYVEELKKTSQYTEANVWTKVIFREHLTAREHMMFFLQFVNEYAEKIGDPVRPFSVKTWEAAYELWNESQQD